MAAETRRHHQRSDFFRFQPRRRGAGLHPPPWHRIRQDNARHRRGSPPTWQGTAQQQQQRAGHHQHSMPNKYITITYCSAAAALSSIISLVTLHHVFRWCSFAAQGRKLPACAVSSASSFPCAETLQRIASPFHSSLRSFSFSASASSHSLSSLKRIVSPLDPSFFFQGALYCPLCCIRYEPKVITHKQILLLLIAIYNHYI